jgi:hypothetical protein
MPINPDTSISYLFPGTFNPERPFGVQIFVFEHSGHIILYQAIGLLNVHLNTGRTCH